MLGYNQRRGEEEMFLTLSLSSCEFLLYEIKMSTVDLCEHHKDESDDLSLLLDDSFPWVPTPKRATSAFADLAEKKKVSV